MDRVTPTVSGRRGSGAAGGEEPGVAEASGTERLDAAVWRTRLPGGPRVLSERIDGVASAAVGIWIPHGAAHDAPSEGGASHLLEHLVFKGTRKRSARDLALEVERVGGSVDGYTTHEFTAFEARVPADQLDRALDVLADLVFHPLLRRRDLELERQVVLEEISEMEDDPEDTAFELHGELLYAGHPYGASILGTRETVSALDVDTLRRIHAERFVGPAVVVAAAGRVDHEALLDRVRELVPEGNGRPAAGVPDVDGGGGGRRRLTRPGIRQAHIVVGGTTVPYRDPLRWALVLVDAALGGGMSSRLFQRIREDLGLAYTVYSFHGFHAAGGHLGAYVGTGAATADRARDVLLEEVARVAEEGLTVEELDGAKTQLRGRILLSLESPGARVARLASIALYGEPFRTLDEVAARVDRVTEGEARAAAALLDPDRLALLELVPEVATRGGAEP